MNNLRALAVVIGVLATGLAGETRAVPIGNSGDVMNYWHNASDLDRWSAGVYLAPRERNISHDRVAGHTLLTEDELMLYVAYDVRRWLALYVTAAGGESKTEGWESDGTFDVGVGVRLGLLDHDIMDPWLIEDRIRITGYLQQTFTGTTVAGRDTQWMETYASLVFSVINEVTGSKLYLPHAIGAFVGPVFSDIQSRGLSNLDVNEQRQFGSVVGIEIFYSDRVSLELCTESFGPSATKAGIHVRF